MDDKVVDGHNQDMNHYYVSFLSLQFPADKYSISYNGKLYGVDVDEIVDGWMRAWELYSDPEFIKEGVTKDDVNQGAAGEFRIAMIDGVLEEG